MSRELSLDAIRYLSDLIHVGWSQDVDYSVGEPEGEIRKCWEIHPWVPR